MRGIGALEAGAFGDAGECQRDPLGSSLTNWAAAVTARDARLVENDQRLRRMADEANASTRRFNEVVSAHNATAKELDALRAHALATNAVTKPMP